MKEATCQKYFILSFDVDIGDHMKKLQGNSAQLLVFNNKEIIFIGNFEGTHSELVPSINMLGSFSHSSNYNN